MKIKSLFLLTCALSLGSMLHATTYIEITGSTAFRTAASNAISAAFAAGQAQVGGLTVATAYSSTDATGVATDITSGVFQAWKGTYPGIAGTTVVRTCWNGAVEGIRALLVPGVANNPNFLTEASIGAAGTSTPYTYVAAPLEQATADLALSDVKQNSTPITGSLLGGPCGIVTFAVVANKTWADDTASSGPTSSVKSVTAQQLKALLSAGKLPLSFFTGNSADTTLVYAIGRNDGSGTRTTALAEGGYGISKAVNQYVNHDTTTATLTKLLYLPQGGGFNFQNVAKPEYASTVWGLDQDGNGGYASGGDVRDALTKTSTSTAIWAFQDLDESGTYEANEDSQIVAPTKIYLMTYLSTSDAGKARGTGSTPNAFILGYNGVRLDNLGDTGASTLNTSDKALVTTGKYTFWGYEEFYYLSGNSDSATVYTDLKTRIASGLASSSAGLPLSSMTVQRASDGGTVVNGALP